MQSEFDDERGDFGEPDSDDIRRPVQAAGTGSVAGGGEGGGLELIGGVLFLVGCLPAAAVAKALMDGTDLAAQGLGGTAALASMVAGWVGPWPALAIAVAVAVIGALMVIGSLRTEPLRYVAGAAVSGFGLSAIASALAPGAGGQLGEGTGGAITMALGGPWAGILLGLAVIAASVWFAFVLKSEVDDHAPFDDDNFGPVQDQADGFGVGSSIVGAVTGAVTGAVAGAKAMAGRIKRDAPRPAGDDFGIEAGGQSSGLGRGGQRRRKINTKSKRRAKPVTLGDALASGGTEGVSHDEAAALAPDDKALAYMENVWRRASESYQQTQPVPASPYPDDVRLRGEIPEGAAPLSAEAQLEKDSAQAPASNASALGSQGAPTEYPPPLAPPSPTIQAPDIAPFDFHDELSAPMPLVDAPQGHTGSTGRGNAPQPASSSLVGADDPFSAPGTLDHGLTPVEAEALESAVRREGADTVGPKDLPEGVTPLIVKVAHPVPEEAPMASSVEEVLADPAEIARAGDVSAQAMQAGAMPAEFTPPPAPAWETGYSEGSGELEEFLPAPENIADVEPGGRWARRDDDIDAESDPLILRDGDVLAAAASVEGSAVETTEEAAPKTFDEMVEEAEVVAAALEDVLGSELKVPAGEIPEEEIPEEEIAEAEFEDDEEESDEEESEEAAELEEGEDEEEAAELEEGEDEEEAAELEEGEDEEEVVEWVDEDGNPIAPEDLGEEYELEEEEAAELEEDEEEEYEYVDEDGNPIDPEDVDEEWEVVEDDEELEEAAEHEEAEVATEVTTGDELEGEEKPSAASESAEDDGEWEEDWEEGDDVAEASAEKESLDGEAESVSGSAESDPESTVILEPQAPPAAVAPEPESLPETPEPAAAAKTTRSDGQRLLAAGRIVVQEGRVAVSLLQREFEMEFDDACAVLDELQKEGLIGPYKGGKARDILLTAEEWEGRFAHS